ncbi:MAG: demethoxyubiquinone hydroxylase family protein, partial [Betaproteobacteria bacterium]|nr:demethoxyubiquinone hydroxylase family protein [Betaproteobacteria bacterium]
MTTRFPRPGSDTRAPASLQDRLLALADNALKTLAGGLHASRPTPEAPRGASPRALEDAERELSGRLMRV